MFLEFKKEDGKEILDLNQVEYVRKDNEGCIVYSKSSAVWVLELLPENQANIDLLIDTLRAKKTVDEYEKGLADGRKEILFAVQTSLIEAMDLPVKEYKKKMFQLIKDIAKHGK